MIGVQRLGPTFDVRLFLFDVRLRCSFDPSILGLILLGVKSRSFVWKKRHKNRSGSYHCKWHYDWFSNLATIWRLGWLDLFGVDFHYLLIAGNGTSHTFIAMQELLVWRWSVVEFLRLLFSLEWNRRYRSASFQSSKSRSPGDIFVAILSIDQAMGNKKMKEHMSWWYKLAFWSLVAGHSTVERVT